MKFCVAILSYGTVPRIRQVIDALGDLPIYVFNTTKSWWDDSQLDHTETAVRGLNVTVVREEWHSQHEALNYAKQYCKDLGYDIMLIFDTDEVVENLPVLLDYIEKNGHDAYCAHLTEYATDGVTKLRARGHCPIVAITLKHDGQFYDKRCYRGNWVVVPKVEIHHFSLSNTDEYKYKIGNKKYGDAFPPLEYRGEI